MKRLSIRIAFIALLGLALSISLVAQGRGGGAGARGAGQGARGTAPQNGARGTNNEVAQQRQAIQAKQKAAIAQENASFRLTMQSIRANAKNAKDENARTQAKMEANAAQRNHQAALQRIRAEGASAMAGLRKQ